MGRKTPLKALHLGLNKTPSFLSVETFQKDLYLSMLHDLLFITKLRIGWKPLKFLIKNKRFPFKKPFLYSPKYFYHSIRIVKNLSKTIIKLNIWDINSNKKISNSDVKLNKHTINFLKKFKKNFREQFFIIGKKIYQKSNSDLELKVNFAKGSFWIKKLSFLRNTQKNTDSERYSISKIDYSYMKQKEFKFMIKNKRFGFLLQCFLYALYQLDTDLLLKLFCKILSKIRKKANKGKIILKQFVKIFKILPFFFNSANIGLRIFLKGRLWLSFRKKRLTLSFGCLKKNTLSKSINESTGKVFTRYGVFGIKILMSRSYTK